MKNSDFQNDEQARLKSLQELALIDTPPEPVFDEIVQRAANFCETPMALLTLIDANRQWFKAKIGFALPELPRTIGFDSKTILQREPLVIPNALEDPAYSQDLLVQSELNVRFYAGVPLTTSDGHRIGVLSVMDFRGRELTARQIKALLEESKKAMLEFEKRRIQLAYVQDGLKHELSTEKKILKPKQNPDEQKTILPDVMMRFSRDLRYMYVSPFAIDTLGMKPDSLLGTLIGEERTPAPFSALLKPSLERILQNKRIEEVRFYAPSPSGERLFQTRLMPELASGEVTAILAIIRETSDDDRAETVIVEVPVEVKVPYEVRVEVPVEIKVPYEVFIEVPVEVLVPAKPNLRSLLGLAITEAPSLEIMLQNCALVLAEFSEAAVVRLWVRTIQESKLSLRGSAGKLISEVTGEAGTLVLDLPESATSLPGVGEMALTADSDAISKLNLGSRELFPLSAGNLLLGVVVLLDTNTMPREIRDEIRESIGIVSVNLRRIQDSSLLTEHSTMLAKELTDAKYALQRESESSASLAHDMRTPLNSVLGFTNLLLGTQLDSTQRELGEMTRTSAQALLEMVRGILDQSQREAGQSRLENVVFDLRSLVEEVSEILAPKAHGKGLEIVVHCAPTLPSRLLGDVNKIRQILMNLGDNSLKFTSKGYLLLDITHETPEAGKVIVNIDVEDTGMGIAPEKLEQIFERYMQADSTKNHPDNGSGLGLSISREFAVQMRGNLAVRSRLGEGSIFRLSLRLPIEPDALPVSHVEPELSRLRVLIVDGSKLQQFSLQEQLFAWGVEALLCPSAEEMLEALASGRKSGAPFHMALLDEKMSGYNNQTLSIAIQNDPALALTKVVLLSSVGNRQAQSLAAEGLVSYLTKPVRSGPLKETLLSEALGLKEREESLVESPAEAKEAAPVIPALPIPSIPVELANAPEVEKIEPVSPPISETQLAPSEIETPPVAPLPEAVEAKKSEVEGQVASPQASQVDKSDQKTVEIPVQEPSVQNHPETELPFSTESEIAHRESPEPVAPVSEPHDTPSERATPTVEVAPKPADRGGDRPEMKRADKASSTSYFDPPSMFSIPIPSLSIPESIVEAETPDPIEINQDVEDIRLKAMVVDDNSVNLRLHQMLLEQMGYVVDTAASGLEALDLFDTRVYDLILVDCQLAGIDGFQTTSMMRRREGGEYHTPIIAVTGETRPDIREKCLESGMDDYMLKPVSSEQLVEKIDSLKNPKSEETGVGEPEPGMLVAEEGKATKSPSMAYDIKALTGKVTKPPKPGDAATEMLTKADLALMHIAAEKKIEETRREAELDSIVDRTALVSRVAGSREVLQSLTNLCKVECTRQVSEMRTAIGEGDRNTFLRATHKLRGMLVSLDAKAAVEAVRKLELTANQGRPADAEAQLNALGGELERLHGAMLSILAVMP